MSKYNLRAKYMGSGNNESRSDDPELILDLVEIQKSFS